MSDDVHKPAKVSREGVVLIKSFEGFRPRAVQREDGGWVIGYGHTLSAREGATVSEAEAELLLQYDRCCIRIRALPRLGLVGQGKWVLECSLVQSKKTSVVLT